MKGLLALGLWLLVVPTAKSQEPRATRNQPTAAAPKVFLITIGQGAVYWEKYGHNMLWFYDPARGVDLAYNWGSFDFDQPGFLRRQLLGDPQYWVDTIPSRVVFPYYRSRDRGITLQELNLTPEQARKAHEYVQHNMRPENRHYRYDYFLDNCSTRVRDVIDMALGGALESATQDTVRQSYRGETLRLLNDLKLTQLGVHFALARPADRELTLWEDMFIPMRMRDALRGLRVRGASGALEPVVVREQVLYESQAHHERTTPPVLWVPYLIIGLLLAAELFLVGFVGARSAVVEKVFRFEVGLWALVTGVLGAILLGAWAGTQHTFWYDNENLLLVNPLALFLAVLAPLSVWRPRLQRPAAIVAIIIAMLGAVAVVLKGLPWPSQQNGALILLILPANFVIAFRLWMRVAVVRVTGDEAAAAPDQRG